MAKIANKEVKTSAQYKSKKKWGWVLVSFILVVIVGFGSGIIQFYSAYVGCGKSPIIVQPGSSFAGGYGPGYYTEEDQTYGPAWDNSYYCSQKEAEAAGFQPSPLSKEGLKRGEAESKRLREQNQ